MVKSFTKKCTKIWKTFTVTADQAVHMWSTGFHILKRREESQNDGPRAGGSSSVRTDENIGNLVKFRPMTAEYFLGVTKCFWLRPHAKYQDIAIEQEHSAPVAWQRSRPLCEVCVWLRSRSMCSDIHHTHQTFYFCEFGSRRLSIFPKSNIPCKRGVSTTQRTSNARWPRDWKKYPEISSQDRRSQTRKKKMFIVWNWYSFYM